MLPLSRLTSIKADNFGSAWILWKMLRSYLQSKWVKFLSEMSVRPLATASPSEQLCLIAIILNFISI